MFFRSLNWRPDRNRELRRMRLGPERTDGATLENIIQSACRAASVGVGVMLWDMDREHWYVPDSREDAIKAIRAMPSNGNPA